MFDVKIGDFFLFRARQSFDSCEEFDVFRSRELVVQRVELGTNSDSCKYFVDCSVDFVSFEQHPSVSFRNRCGKNIESGRLPSSIRSQESKGFALLDDKRVVSDRSVSIWVLFEQRVDDDRFCFLQILYF